MSRLKAYIPYEERDEFGRRKSVGSSRIDPKRARKQRRREGWRTREQARIATAEVLV